jgi:hypothetical protein
MSALRDFDAGTVLMTSGRVCSRPGRASPLTLAYELRDSTDAVVWSTTADIVPGEDGCRPFDQRIDTSQLAAGEFLVRVTAGDAAGTRQTRDVRFTLHGQRFFSSFH